mgnify:CR=1 FL=1
MIARSRMLAASAATLLAGGLLAACTSEAGPPAPAPEPTSPPVVNELTLGVWGAEAEIETYQRVVDRYNRESETSQVELVSWRSREAAMADLRTGEADPDVYMAARQDLPVLREEGLTRPVDELLDERFVEFGDGYARAALEAFAIDRRLQCMPFAVSPTLMYVNTDLVDFERMERRGLPVTSSATRWDLEEFAAAAQFATKPRRNTRGVHIEPSLRGLAPFIYSGGGSLFDDDEQPTSLAFSSDGTRDALERTLEVLRSSALTLTPAQLEQADALEWFERGKLGMIAGDRSLVPELRSVEGLDFDVMPMPTLDSAATVGELTGLCLNPDTESVSGSADLLVHLISDQVVRRLTRAGYLVPANQNVALSDDFLQPEQQPESAARFTYAVRSMVELPLIEDYVELIEVTREDVADLVTSPGLLDLEQKTLDIDEASRTVLAPETETPSPSEGADEGDEETGE